jgi:DNA-binding NarL/FixJ family response regulator
MIFTQWEKRPHLLRRCNGTSEFVPMTKALIIEDNAAFGQALEEVLHSHFPSLKIATETDGSGLLPKIEIFRPDIVFMDIRLPGDNGLVLAKKIKEKYPGITVVIVTSYDLPEYREAARRSGADYFITKESALSAELFWD